MVSKAPKTKQKVKRMRKHILPFIGMNTCTCDGLLNLIMLWELTHGGVPKSGFGYPGWTELHHGKNLPGEQWKRFTAVQHLWYPQILESLVYACPNYKRSIRDGLTTWNLFIWCTQKLSVSSRSAPTPKPPTSPPYQGPGTPYVALALSVISETTEDRWKQVMLTLEWLPKRVSERGIASSFFLSSFQGSKDRIFFEGQTRPDIAHG